VTISFMPDGTQTGGGPSNLFATMNAKFGSPGAWEPQMILAAQQWAAQSNLNLFVVGDNGTPIGGGAYLQGDPGMGDIRIGGLNMSTTGPLAYTSFPPPANNFSISGDMLFNTAYTWNIGSQYDIFTVATHEFGHALGLGHSTDPNAAMYAGYTGSKGINSDDSAGIRAIYSGGNPRSPDAFDGANSTWQTSTDLTGYINPRSNTVLMQNLDIYSLTTPEWFVVRAPSNTAGNPLIMVQTLYQSMLFQQVYVYSGGNLIGSGNVGYPWNGSILDVGLAGITPGQMIYIEVTSATTMPFGVGNYALAVNFGPGPTPSVGPPATATYDGNPIVFGGSIAEVRGISERNGDRFPDPPPTAATETSSVAAADVATLLQVVQVTPASAGIVPVQPVVLVGPAVVAPAASSTLVVPAGNGTVAQPAPILFEGTASPFADDAVPEQIISDGGANNVSVSFSVPAPLAVTAQPEQAIRELPMPTARWSDLTTAYFKAGADRHDDVMPLVSSEPSSVALQAAAALAGFVAFAGENRMRLHKNDEEERQGHHGS
jgi:hypothetical protein